MASAFLRSAIRASARPSARSFFTSSRLLGGHGEVSIAKPSVDGIPRTADKIVKIMFIDADNNRFPVDGICGETLFQTAQRYHVNYRHTCGGRNSVSSSWDEGLACYQCHVHIGNDHVDLVNKANKTSESELAQLSNCDADRGDVTRNSRLSCQITLTPELDGMLVLIPTFPEEDTV